MYSSYGKQEQCRDHLRNEKASLEKRVSTIEDTLANTLSRATDDEVRDHQLPLRRGVA